jgi:RNA polymerase sigma-70 factor (ECF subfamily)
VRLNKPNDVADSASEAPADEQLMRRYLDGDVAAFETLMDRYGSKITRYVARNSADPHAVDDLVQDIFTRVVHRAPSFRGQSSFKTWLYTIARNLCIDTSRKRGHRKAVTLDEPVRRSDAGGATIIEQTSDPGPGPERLASDSRFRECLEEALGELPEEQREAFAMREFQGLKFREIGEVLGIPENTVKSRVRYALQSLRASLQRFEDRRG